jgi:hypothetical protein
VSSMVLQSPTLLPPSFPTRNIRHWYPVFFFFM